jgi:AcrR family transcriptional regulator
MVTVTDAIPSPKTSRGERTRQRILAAAERQIGRRGFADTSVASITLEAKVAQGTFYVYFRTKEEVLRELVLRMGRRLRRSLTLATAGVADRLEVERRGIHAFFAFVRKNPNLYRVVAESQFVDEAAYRRYYTDFAESYRIALQAAADAGQISPGDAELRAWALMGLCDMAGRRYALWETEAPFEAAAEAAFDFVAHGLAPR